MSSRPAARDPCACADSATSSAASSTTWTRLKSMVSSSSLPASTFEKSRMSLMIVSSASPAPRTPSAYCRWRSSSSVFSSRPVSPMTPFIGVRISWLIVARNADLAREASSASSRVSASSRRASRSERSRRAVRMNASTSRIAHADGQLDRLHAEADRATSISTSAGGTTQRDDGDAELGERRLGLVVVDVVGACGGCGSRAPSAPRRPASRRSPSPR